MPEPIRLTDHAREMLQDRGIPEEWVARAIALPDRTEPDPRGAPLMRSYKTIPEAGGRMLRVVHRTDGGATIIVTAFFDRGAGP